MPFLITWALHSVKKYMGKITHGDRHTRFYKVFIGVKTRCYNKNRDDYKYYGGKGIICEWKHYEGFKEDMYEDYCKHIKCFGSKNTTLERINSNGNYSKNNCKWATWKYQQNHRSNNIHIKYNGKIKTVSEWSEELNIKSGTIYSRIYRGWNINKVLKNIE